MASHDILVVGASAGGVEALRQMAAVLPADFQAAVFVVLHVPANGKSVLPHILSRAGPLPAVHARDRQTIEKGRIYIAPPDHHLLIQPGTIRVTSGPRENSHRPAVDPLFRTAAQSYGSRAIGLVLSGSLDDGTAGLLAIKREGGLAIVQNPGDALYPSMPQSALDNVAVDYCVALSELGPLLASLFLSPAAVTQESPMAQNNTTEHDPALDPVNHQEGIDGSPSVFGCPDCGGVLWEYQEGEMTRFRCRVGHAWTADSLLAEQAETLEAALWAALRGLEERAELARRLAERARQRNWPQSVDAFDQQGEEAKHHVDVIRRVLMRRKSLEAADMPPAERGA
jgi:two-component system chemotaxis response regulator CheB